MTTAAGKSKRRIGVDKKRVLEQLKQVVDPELGVDIVNLGLVYDVEIKNSEIDKGVIVHVKMTLTSPGCPLAPIIHEEVEKAVMKVDGVDDVELEIVWDPPWSLDKVSKETRLLFGW